RRHGPRRRPGSGRPRRGLPALDEDAGVPRMAEDKTYEPVSYAIYWFRNTTPKGEPKFAPPSRFLTIPAPWELDAFSVVDRGQDGRLDLVVSISKYLYTDWMDGTFHVESQLWRYRRRG